MRRLALVVLAVAACGGHGSSGSPDATAGADAAGDAPVADAGSADAQPADAQTYGPVTVTFRSGAEMGVVAVLFSDPDGTLASRAVPAGTEATGELGIGGSVTIVRRSTRGSSHETIADVAPGDHLYFGALPDESLGSGDAIFLSVPALSGTSVYSAHGPGFLVVQGIEPQLAGSLVYGFTTTTGDVVVRSEGENGLRYLVDRGVTVSPKAHLTLTGTWHLPGGFPVQVTGGPATLSVVKAGRSLYSGPWYLHSTGYSTATPTDGAATVELETPGVAGDTALLYLQVQRADLAGYQDCVWRDATDATSAVVDLGQVGLPWWPDPPALTGDVMSWTTEAAGRAPQLVRVGVREVMSDSTQSASWVVTAPGDAQSFTLPALPDDLADTWPADPLATYTDGVFFARDGGTYATGHLDPYAFQYGPLDSTSTWTAESSTGDPPS